MADDRPAAPAVGLSGLHLPPITRPSARLIAHGVGNEKQVSALALNAGIDQDMVGEVFLRNTWRRISRTARCRPPSLMPPAAAFWKPSTSSGLFHGPLPQGLSAERAPSQHPDEARIYRRRPRHCPAQRWCCCKNEGSDPAAEKNRYAWPSSVRWPTGSAT